MGMPVSTAKAEEDPRIAELREVNARLTTVVALLKAKHTPRSIETSIANAEAFLNDHTPAFITIGGASFEGTRHVASLMSLCDALDVKVEMNGKGGLVECSALLGRKVRLLRELHSV
jgi:hypothetical protein